MAQSPQQLLVLSERIAELAKAAPAPGSNAERTFPVKVAITAPNFKGTIGPSGVGDSDQGGGQDEPDVAYFWGGIALAVVAAIAGAAATEAFDDDCNITISHETTTDAQGNITGGKTTVTRSCDV
jgi:hypothetical protein